MQYYYYTSYSVSATVLPYSAAQYAQLLMDSWFVSVGEKSASGLLEWESVNDAMEALAVMNHFQMKNPSKKLQISY